MLEDTNLKGLGEALEQAEKEHSINGLYLMGLACLESSYGNSRYAKEKNNLVGWNAVDSNPNKATFFTSKDECILYVAYKLKTNYLTEGACYFNGYSAKAIDVKYCSDKQHANKIINIVNKLIDKL
jgi:beta-N-acetylglucosaminidase